jgi:hypothetical protein
MALKWGAVVVAAISVTVVVTANVLVAVLRTGDVPIVINMAAIASAGVAVILAVVAEMYGRINARITVLSEFLVNRLNELDTHAGDRNAGFVEGFLLSQGQDAAVVPIGPRQGRRAMNGADD